MASRPHLTVPGPTPVIHPESVPPCSDEPTAATYRGIHALARYCNMNKGCLDVDRYFRLQAFRVAYAELERDLLRPQRRAGTPLTRFPPFRAVADVLAEDHRCRRWRLGADIPYKRAWGPAHHLARCVFRIIADTDHEAEALVYAERFVRGPNRCLCCSVETRWNRRTWALVMHKLEKEIASRMRTIARQ